ncbi:unnamed protein product [Adineta steineri]|uniref:Uncharacterized protein n=1 Tax=Adineta steineri TaxID=433720 RepID=A0A813WX52_9BILA|nr:unnamed protein product [Adineta steineri]
MRFRGRRSLNFICLIRLLICTICILISIFIFHIIYTIIIYNYFIQTYQFSTEPFWKDNRTIHDKILLPTISIENVNLSNATIVIAACCRNVRKNLGVFQKHIRSITAFFHDYRIYLGESDSHDETLSLLYDWQKSDADHVRVHTKGHQRWYGLSRTNRIASCRNTLLQQAREELSSFDYYLVIDVDVGACTNRIASCRNTLLQQAREELSSFDYYLVIDVDVGACTSFDVKDFLSNFIYPDSSWLAMTATQRSEYYDIWALRIESIIPYDCWQLINELTSFFIDNSYLTERLVNIHQKPIPRNISLIQVESAFGGAAIYNAKYLHKDCSYIGKYEGYWWWSSSQCEHVPFHRCIQQYAQEQKIYINPQFQIC